MASNRSQMEVEIKLPLPDAGRGRRLLRAAGYRILRRRVFESNTVYDRPPGELRSTGELLRLRSSGRAWLLTYKGPSIPGRHKTRPEFEVSVSGGAPMDHILQRLGYVPAFRYEKFRTEFRKRPGPGVVVLDETPIGVFLELEGPAEWIDRAAGELGFEEASYITASYGALYMEDCRRRGLAPSHMTFAPTP
ncbi:MAG: class IV adenylate cyclase [Bryobacteraceae bacterium]